MPNNYFAPGSFGNFSSCDDRMAILKNQMLPRDFSKYEEIKDEREYNEFIESGKSKESCYTLVDVDGTVKKMPLHKLLYPYWEHGDWEAKIDSEGRIPFGYIFNKPDKYVEINIKGEPHYVSAQTLLDESLFDSEGYLINSESIIDHIRIASVQQADLDSEAQERAFEDFILQNQIDLLMDLLSFETSERIAIDTDHTQRIGTLEDRMDSEESIRSWWDNRIWARIDNLASEGIFTRDQIISWIWNIVTSEATLREAADLLLADAITSEGLARIAGDLQTEANAALYTDAETLILDNKKQDKLTAKAPIHIDSEGNIWTDVNYTAGDNITISSEGVISAIDTKYPLMNWQASQDFEAGLIGATDWKYLNRLINIPSLLDYDKEKNVKQTGITPHSEPSSLYKVIFDEFGHIEQADTVTGSDIKDLVGSIFDYTSDDSKIVIDNTNRKISTNINIVDIQAGPGVEIREIEPVGGDKYNLIYSSEATIAYNLSTELNNKFNTQVGTYTIGKSVPSDAAFTDTKYTFKRGLPDKAEDFNVDSNNNVTLNINVGQGLDSTSWWNERKIELDGASSGTLASEGFVITKVNEEKTEREAADTNITNTLLTRIVNLETNKQDKFIVDTVTGLKYKFVVENKKIGLEPIS